MDQPEHKEELVLQGIPVSAGIAIGRAHLLQRERLQTDRYFLDPSQVPTEIERFKGAVAESISQIEELKGKLLRELGTEHAYIIDTHLLIARDSMIIDGVTQRIEENRINAEAALGEVAESFKSVFRGLEDEYLRERHSDVEDVISRIVRNLAGHQDLIGDIPPGAIVVAPDLSPSETAQMDRTRILGFTTERGGRTGHTAIMARSLEIPAVVGVENITRQVPGGVTVILDGNAGKVIVNPTPQTLEEYRRYQRSFRYYEAELLKLRDLPAMTTDGETVRLMANIELPAEAPAVIEHGAEGIGLYRTEFLYMNRSDLPGEEEHFRTYRRLVEDLKGRSAVVRTLDLGGDKFLSQISAAREINPALGLRAIRLCLQQKELFREQLRGILRASRFGPIKLMFPMVSCLEELREARGVLDTAKEELRRRGEEFDEGIKVGTMIETPSAVIIADLLARETDFFSIGTNDLIQYALAIDRINQNVAYLYNPLHPAVLRAIRSVITAARSREIPVSMCGEMAGEPIYTVILLGLGLTELSMNAVSIPRVKKIIRSLSMEEARALAARALEMSTAQEVERFVKQKMVDRFPDDITPDGRQMCLL